MADTKVFLSGGRIQGASTDTLPIPQTSWKEIDRVDGNGIRVMDTYTSGGNFTPPDVMMIIFNKNGTGAGGVLTFNNDSATDTYERNFSYNGGAWASQTGEAGINWYANSGDGADFSIMHIENRSGSEKSFVATQMEAGDSGAGNGTNSVELSGKWIGTDQINRVAIDAGSGNTFPAGTELIVLGYDYDEADSGTSFWTQIASTTLTSTPSTSGSAASPQIGLSWTGDYKYLWVSGYVYMSTDWTTTFDEKNASGDYTWDYSTNGVSYTNIGSSASHAGFHVTGDAGWTAFQAVITNMSGKEKMYWYNGGHIVDNSNSQAPSWRRVFGKGTYGTGQIHSIQFWSGSMTVNAPSTVTVWGAN